jgi:hypothetical protein
MPPPSPPGSTDPDIDVVITTRDDGPGLRDQVERLPREGIHELFIVDRASTDIDALNVLARLEAVGYHVVRQDQRSLSRARNEGLRVSRAPFLVNLDAGTVPLEPFLAEASTILSEDSTVAAVRADGRWSGSDDPIVVCGLDPPSIVTAVYFEPFAVLRRAAIEKIGGWDDRLKTGQDRDLFLSLMETGWSFAKLASIGFSRSEGAGGQVAPADYPAVQADGIHMAEKHRDLYAAHYPSMIGAYAVTLAKAGAGWSEAGSSSGAERAVRDLMDQLAAVRAELARSEADGVRAREIVADVSSDQLEVKEAHAQIKALDQEISAIRATRSQRVVTALWRVYEKFR